MNTSPHKTLALQALEQMMERFAQQKIRLGDVTPDRWSELKDEHDRIQAAMEWVKRQED